MKKLLPLLMSIILVMGVCVCFSSCNKDESDSPSDEASNPSRNTVFTDEYFKDAVHICMSLYSGDYGGEEMEAVIDVLKSVSLEPTDRSIYPWENTSSDVSKDPLNKLCWAPFVCRIYYADGSKSTFEFTGAHVALAGENYTVTTQDLTKRIMNAVGIVEGEYSCTEPFSEYFQDFCPGAFR